MTLSYVEAGAETRFRHDTYRLYGKNIVILGDADGIGRAAAAMMVERAAKVFIAVSSPAELTAAFAEIAPAGGEWDGMVVDLQEPGEIGLFFDQAESRLSKIDVLVCLLEAELWFQTREGLDTGQGLCIEEAVERMQNRRNAQIISIGAAGSSIPANLRREARQKGIRITLIDPGPIFHADPELPLPGTARVHPALERQAMARCVLDSIGQSYGPDVIFMKDVHAIY